MAGWLVRHGGVLAICAHERLDWTNADVLKFAIAATVGVGSICGFVIWQLGDNTRRPRGEDEDLSECQFNLRSFVGRPVVAGAPLRRNLEPRISFNHVRRWKMSVIRARLNLPVGASRGRRGYCPCFVRVRESTERATGGRPPVATYRISWLSPSG